MKSGSKHPILGTMYVVIMLTATLLTLSAIRLTPSAMADPGWLTGWAYRKSHIVGSVVNAGSGYQIELIIYYGSGSDSGQTAYLNGQCLANFGDVRFTSSDGTTLLNYWIQEQVNGDHAVFWVKLNDDISSANSTIYMYYGNASAATTSNGNNTFVFFDDFSGDSLDSSKWTVRQGNVAVTGGELVLNGTSNLSERGLIDGLTSFGTNVALHTKARFSDANSIYHHFCSMRESGKFDNRSSDVWTTGSTDQIGLETVESNYSSILTYTVNDLTKSHEYESQWKAGQTRFLVDGSPVGTISSYVPSTDMVVYYLESQSEGKYCFIDYCFVSKWVDPEPINGAWGAQEQGQKPKLTIDPEFVSCRKLGEIFTIKVNLSEPYYAEDFELKILFNTTLLDYVGGAWSTWTGPISADEANGIILGSASGTAVTGNLTILSITFSASYNHIWKNEATMSGWKNDQIGSIFIQQANLSYSISPDLRYERGSLNQIEVGPDTVYKWSPIKGDVNLDGRVDIFDLSAVAGYIGVTEYSPLWPAASKYDLTKAGSGAGAIEILDIIIVATNYGYQYNP